MQRTLILDLDGTLVDSAPDIVDALNRSMRTRALAPFTLAETTAMIGNGAHVLYQAASAARGVAFDEAAFEAFLSDYTANAAVATRPFAGVATTLAAMRQQDWVFAVCTNKPYGATVALLKGLDLLPWFEAVGGGDSFPTRKPDPAHLLATLSAAGGRAEAAVMVGDHRNDVLAANGAGVACIFAGWGYGPSEMGQGAAGTAPCFADIAAMAERLVPK